MPPTPPLVMSCALLLAGLLACSASPGTGATGGSSSGDSDAAQTTDVAQPSTSAQPTTDAELPTSTGATTSSASTSGTTLDPTTTADPTSTSTSTTLGDTTEAVASTSSTTSDSSTSDSSTSTGDSDALGMISGECGLIDAMELESPQPFVFANAIDLGAGGFDEALLTPGGQQMIEEGGLNDGSLKSEVIAFEVLARCDMASLLKTEGKIVYTDPMGKKTDILLEMGGHKVGVSVVRAVGFPKDDPYTVAQATTILKKKLGDIQISSQNVAPEDAWIKQILHVVAYGPMHVDSVLAAYEALDAPLKADTILVVSVTDGDDALLY